MVSSSKANPQPVSNRKSPMALAHAYAFKLMIACVLICCVVVFTDSWCMATSRGCGQACFTSSLSRAHRLLLPSYLIHAPVAGFNGLLLLVLLRGIRLLRQETSIRACLICLLQVFGFLGFYVLDLFSSASSSHVLIFVFV